jgi:hypothetical protein
MSTISPTRALHLVLTSLLLGACGGAEPHATGRVSGGADRDALIIGAVDWREVTTLAPDAPERRASGAVGYLELPARGSRCTAFLVAPDLVMTNHHCVGAEADAEGARVHFGREAGASPAAWRTHRCDTFVYADEALDVALLACEGDPGATQGVLELDAEPAEAGRSIYVLHQNCDYFTRPSCDPTKKYSPGRITRAGGELEHDADTLGGSSGSPVLDARTHRVVGLHHAGSGNDGRGRGRTNLAVPMARLLPVLAARLPGLGLGAAPAPAPAAVEPNETPATAAPIARPFAREDLEIAGGGDVDHFALELAERAGVTVTLRLSHALGDLDLHVLDRTGRVVAASEGTTDEEQLALDLGPGRWVLRVVGYRGATGAYALDVR